MLALLGGDLATWSAREATAQGVPPEEDLVVGGTVVGRYYRQTGGGSGLGFGVADPFFAPYLGLGGPGVVGYPVSTPFRGIEGCLYQTFQVLLLQTCGGGPVRLANTFEILESAGADPVLMGLGVGSAERDTAPSFDAAVELRLGWLQEDAIRQRYLADCGGGDARAAVERCGLPMNRPQRFGPFVSQRFQRIAFQHWLLEGPAGIRAGDVTAVLGGDLLKATGVLSGAATQPHARGEPPPPPLVSFAPVAVAAPALAAGPPVDFRDRATLGILETQVDTAARVTPAEFVPGQQGQDLAVGDRVRTDVTGNALVTYFEGTTAQVAPSSEVVLLRAETAADGHPSPLLVVRQAVGDVIYRLTRPFFPGGRVEIETPAATATVRGTVLGVIVSPSGQTRIEVYSGQVEVAAGGIVVVAYAGTFTEITPGQPPTPPALLPPAPPFSLAPPPDPAAAAATGTAAAKAASGGLTATAQAVGAGPSASPAGTTTPTPTWTPAPKPSPTPTPGAGSSGGGPSGPPGPSATPTATPPPTASATEPLANSPTASAPPTTPVTTSPTSTAAPASPSATATASASPTASPTSTATASFSPSATASPTSTATASPTPTPLPE